MGSRAHLRGHAHLRGQVDFVHGVMSMGTGRSIHPWGRVDFVERPMGTGRFSHLRGQVGWSLQKAHYTNYTGTGQFLCSIRWGQVDFVGRGDGCGWHEPKNPCFIWYRPNS
jgi:hypothetical protein